MTIVWLIEKMDCYPQFEDQTNVVFMVYWRINANDGVYNATINGAVNIAYVPESSYVSYNLLSQEQVIGWVKAVMPLDQISALENNLTTSINNQKNPPVASLPLPWTAQ
jgi:hypothetical protein